MAVVSIWLCQSVCALCIRTNCRYLLLLLCIPQGTQHKYSLAMCGDAYFFTIACLCGVSYMTSFSAVLSCCYVMHSGHALMTTDAAFCGLQGHVQELQRKRHTVQSRALSRHHYLNDLCCACIHVLTGRTNTKAVSPVGHMIRHHTGNQNGRYI